MFAQGIRLCVSEGLEICTGAGILDLSKMTVSGGVRTQRKCPLSMALIYKCEFCAVVKYSNFGPFNYAKLLNFCPNVLNPN